MLSLVIIAFGAELFLVLAVDVAVAGKILYDFLGFAVKIDAQ